MEYKEITQYAVYIERDFNELIGCYRDLDEAKRVVAHINNLRILESKYPFMESRAYIEAIRTDESYVTLSPNKDYIDLELCITPFKIYNYDILEYKDNRVLITKCPIDYEYSFKQSTNGHFILLSKDKLIANKVLEDIKKTYLIDKDYEKLKVLREYLYNLCSL
jgi:hypothetical protein